MSELTEFLLARLAEDEQRASDASCESWLLGKYAGAHAVLSADREFWIAQVGHTSDAYRDGLHIAQWNPARVLAECEAKRQIVAEVLSNPLGKWRNGEPSPWALKMLGILAAPYAYHPDFREEWRP